jgi:hypothetical protein
MALSSAAEQTAPAADREAGRVSLPAGARPAGVPRDFNRPSNRAITIALLALAALWGLKVYATWAAWGDLTVDCGREMYVPAVLAQGRVLYRDVWFLYGPAAPYFNSWLYRLFGMQLSVLYCAGSLAALGSAGFLYLAGVRLAAPLAGWTAGAVVLLESFAPSLFCFPLPYSFSAAYGCLAGCAFLWLALCAMDEPGRGWMLAAATAAAIALLLKLEFGTACYGALALLAGMRWLARRSWRALAADLAACIPGVLLCGLVLRWMLSLGGPEFITQENMVSWPTTFFMKTYGKTWLAATGFALSGGALREALQRAELPLHAALLAAALLWWKRSGVLVNSLRVLLAWTLLLRVFSYRLYSLHSLLGGLRVAAAGLFFPRDMVLYVALALPVAAWCLLRRPGGGRAGKIALLTGYSVVLAFRILMGMATTRYAIYYNGPVVLAFLVLLFLLIPSSGPARRLRLQGELVFCLACLSLVYLDARREEGRARDYVTLRTERGAIRTAPRLAESYRAAISFMKDKASRGQAVLSLPEDPSLYFLSGTESPTRVYQFVPGVVAPGKMTEETIRQIEQRGVRYLLWSNREFAEYGAPVFGVDYNRELGDYLKSRYRPLAPLLPGTPAAGEWAAVIWERKPEAQTP